MYAEKCIKLNEKENFHTIINELGCSTALSTNIDYFN